jgi:tetratricopeptide (TPR) repeat protein
MVPEVPQAPEAPQALQAPEAPQALQDDETTLVGDLEIDLSDALAELGGSAAPPPEPGPPPDLETVFQDIRNRISRGPERSDADAQYDRALEHIRAGRLDEAITDLQAAARVPMLRFTAAAQLGRLYIRRGELQPGIDWLERAAEAPAPTANEGFALLYDLADTLERMGESARALAVLMELETDASDYRDIRSRIERLSRVQAGSHRG